MSRLGPGEVAPGVAKKSAAIKASIENRLSLLQSIVEGKPSPEGMPTNALSAFLLWERAELGIRRIGSVNTVKSFSPEAYRTMKSSLTAIKVGKVVALNAARGPVPSNESKASEEVTQLKCLVGNLTDDLLTLRQGFITLLEDAASIATQSGRHADSIKRYRDRYSLYLVPRNGKKT